MPSLSSYESRGKIGMTLDMNTIKTVKFTFRNVVSTRYQDSDFVEMTHQPNYELDVGLLQNKDWMPN